MKITIENKKEIEKIEWMSIDKILNLISEGSTVTLSDKLINFIKK